MALQTPEHIMKTFKRIFGKFTIIASGMAGHEGEFSKRKKHTDPPQLKRLKLISNVRQCG